ncbi:MAG: lysine 2,3-aminomutase [Desulfobacterium sp.]|jgi:KamA family protein|nr:lysine 2,3-aminomutase [Desulfobacterium sp.]
MQYKPYTIKNLNTLPQLNRFTPEQIFNIKVVGTVLPFKTNNYVVNELINWDDFENDPMFILNFPQREMLSKKHFNTMATLLRANPSKEQITAAANRIRYSLNPHPAGQLDKNVPEIDGQRLKGIQHKYRETMLFFPTQGQTCHAFCSFCFRWPQFTGMNGQRFAMKDADLMVRYISEHPELTDILFTGGDPLTMGTRILSVYLNAILDARIPNIRTIRIGTKTLSFWPHRFTTDKDSQALLMLFKRVTDSGIHLAIMSHINHPKEISTSDCKRAIEAIKNTGATIRSQSPILNKINASSGIWSKMWKDQVSLGIVPYYMFVARNTGAQDYFSVPLVDAWKIYREAYSSVSGIARTVRGPSMSASPGKIKIEGITEINDEKVMALNFVQARNPKWVKRLFFAEYDENAVWLDDLKPAFGENKFFFDPPRADRPVELSPAGN